MVVGTKVLIDVVSLHDEAALPCGKMLVAMWVVGSPWSFRCTIRVYRKNINPRVSSFFFLFLGKKDNYTINNNSLLKNLIVLPFHQTL